MRPFAKQEPSKQPDEDDLRAFWKRNGLNVQLSQVTMINVRGGALPPPGGEETLDTEWSSGVAPGAEIRVYAAGSLQFVDLDRALDQIIADLPAHPGMRQLSISLGLGEMFMAPAEVATEHTKFLHMAAAGVNVFVSSGRHHFDAWPALPIRVQEARRRADPALRALDSRTVHIGDDCWLGVNAVVQPGVTVGRGAVIGANAVVTRDVRPYSIVGGVPARPVKSRLEFTPP